MRHGPKLKSEKKSDDLILRQPRGKKIYSLHKKMGVRYKRTPKFLQADILIMSSNAAINVQKKKFLKGSKARCSLVLTFHLALTRVSKKGKVFF